MTVEEFREEIARLLMQIPEATRDLRVEASLARLNSGSGGAERHGSDAIIVGEEVVANHDRFAPFRPRTPERLAWQKAGVCAARLLQPSMGVERQRFLAALRVLVDSSDRSPVAAGSPHGSTAAQALLRTEATKTVGEGVGGPARKPDGWTRAELIGQANHDDGEGPKSLSSTTFDRIRKASRIAAAEPGGVGAQRRFSVAQLRKLIDAAEAGTFRNGRKIAAAWRELLPS